MDGGMREATTSTYLLKIQNEVNFLARLGDVEEIVQLKKAYEDDSHVHLVMDLCAGGSLYDKITSLHNNNNGGCGKEGYFEHFTEERVKLIMRRVLHMILKCHARGIIYRDIKPQNFLYVDDSSSSDIKCSDYGLAMSYIPNNPDGLLLTKRAGTPAYMAPEVVLRRYNEKADLWGAGMLMYQLLAGRFPFWGGELSFTSTLDDIFFDILIREIDFDFIAAMASPEAADLCRNLLRRDPKMRLTAAQAAEHPWMALSGE
jgi:calcium-dependent protein kinase